jgi:hypothetical protein
MLIALQDDDWLDVYLSVNILAEVSVWLLVTSPVHIITINTFLQV